MGQAQPPISNPTQQVNQVVSAIAAANGTATFTFDSPPTGLTTTGSLICAGAPPGASFIATIGTVQWCTFSGNAIGGPIQCKSYQQIVVTATGLLGQNTYECCLIGSSDEETSVQPIYPEPSVATTQIVTLPVGSQIFNGSGAISGGVGQVGPIAVTTTDRTLIVQLVPNANVASPNVTGVFVQGAQTGNIYYGNGGLNSNAVPYLEDVGGSGNYFVICPIDPLRDQTYIIGFTVPGGITSVAVKVWVDTIQYDESVYYNGHARFTAAGASGVLINGPARLLAVTCPPGSAIQIGGQVILNPGANSNGQLTFPENTILEIGQNVSCVNSGAVVWAYP